MVAIGEVGLAGDVRVVSSLPRRLQEARRLGSTTAIVPAGADDAVDEEGLTVVEVTDLGQALRTAFPELRR